MKIKIKTNEAMKYITFGRLEMSSAKAMADDMHPNDVAKEWFNHILDEAAYGIEIDLYEMDEIEQPYYSFIDELNDGWQLYYSSVCDYYFAIKEKI